MVPARRSEPKRAPCDGRRSLVRRHSSIELKDAKLLPPASALVRLGLTHYDCPHIQRPPQPAAISSRDFSRRCAPWRKRWAPARSETGCRDLFGWQVACEQAGHTSAHPVPLQGPAELQHQALLKSARTSACQKRRCTQSANCSRSTPMACPCSLAPHGVERVSSNNHALSGHRGGTAWHLFQVLLQWHRPLPGHPSSAAREFSSRTATHGCGFLAASIMLSDEQP